MDSRSHLSNHTSRLVLLWIVATVSFALCMSPFAFSQTHDEHALGAEDEHHDVTNGHEETIVLEEHDIERMGIVVAPVGPGTIRNTLRLPGEIMLNEDRVAHIVPRFDGVIRDVRKRLGDEVSAGEVMAIIESNTSLQTYKVKSLIAGTIVEKHITLGEFVSTSSDLYIVADLSDVWVDIAVYARDQGAVAIGQEAQIRSNDLNLSSSVVITYMSPLVDKHTRTSLARAILPNPEGRWRPGSFITANILCGEADVSVAVPNRSIETFEDDQIVFVQEDRAFVLRKVTVGLTDGHVTEIVAGLKAGELIVVEGSFTLKAELMKGSFGSGHAH